MAAALKSEVLGSYRYVLRAIRETFQNDVDAVQKSKAAARMEYRKHFGVKDNGQISKMVADARDAADFLRSSIVQAQLNSQTQRYEMKLKSPDDKPQHLNVEPAQLDANGAPKSDCCGGH